ncbi:MAG TPA: DNA internalization-related competence protein ComEC/Rec2 [Gemmatimonadaceae bacterium]|nr:DNA internalization-related competence protein ComEC/Rec2 [Gemmatimonadaceae bacterium]
MPLIAHAFIAHAAGLLLGFGGVSFGGLLAAAALGAAAVVRRDARIGAMALLGAGGELRATAARDADARCARQAIALTPLSDAHVVYEAVVETDAGPSARVAATIGSGGCEVRATLLVENGEAVAGSRVAVRGDAARAGSLIVVQHATVAALARPGLARRWRERAGRAIDRTFGSDAPLARALLIADTRTLDAGIRSRYADAGIVHLLSVSGLHVAIIAGAVELLLSAARMSRAASAWLALLVTAIYVVVIGVPAPAVRSAVMLAATAVSRLTQRPTSPWAALALGAWVPLIEPRIIVDLGYQLSVAGLAALIASGTLARRILAGRLSGWRRVVARDLIVSTLASVVSLPLIAWTFGRMSLIAPVANLAAGPIFTVLQPTLFLALVLSPLASAASIPADAAHVLLGAVDVVASVATRVPYAAVPVAPSLWTAILLGILAVSLLVACSSAPGSAWAWRGAIGGAGAVAAMAVGVRITGGGGVVELHMIDVGQGDALALRTPRGRWVLFDAGRSWIGGDAGRSTVIPYLRKRGGAVHAFVLSHPHSDHVGGAASSVSALAPDEYYDAAYVAGSTPYRASLAAAAARGVAWHRVHPGDSLAIDGVTIRFLAPDSAWTAALHDANEASTVALIQYGRIRFLMTGDAEAGEEQWLLAHDLRSLEADVLKVGHHGSSTSTTAEFLAAVRPRVALISVGVANTYHHPSSDVVRALTESGAQVLRTDQLGTVVIRTNGRVLSVDAGGERWER